MKVVSAVFPGIPSAIIGRHGRFWFVGVEGFLPDSSEDSSGSGGVVFIDRVDSPEQGEESVGFLCVGWLASLGSAIECLRSLSCLIVPTNYPIENIRVISAKNVDLSVGCNAFFCPDVAGKIAAMPDRLAFMFLKVIDFCSDVPADSWRSECALRSFSVCPGDNQDQSVWDGSEGSHISLLASRIRTLLGEGGSSPVKALGSSDEAREDSKDGGGVVALLSDFPMGTDGADLVSPIVASGQSLHVRPVSPPVMKVVSGTSGGSSTVEMSSFVAVPSADPAFKVQDQIKIFLKKMGPRVLKIGDLTKVRKMR